MRAIRIHRRIESETLQLPELKELVGRDVEILVLEEPASVAANGREAGLFSPCPDCRSGPDRS